MKKALLFCVLVPVAAGAQYPSWLQRVTIRESLDSKKVPQPAFLTFLFPSGAKRSYTSGIGARADMAPARVSDYLELGPFVEWAKNTETKKEQDMLKAGAAADWTAWDLTQRTWTPILTSKLHYARDHIAQTTSAQFNLYATVQPRGHGLAKKYWYVPNAPTRIGPIITLYSPSAGIDDDNTLRGTTNEPRNIPRAYGRFAVLVTPSAGWRNYLEYTADLSYRPPSRRSGRSGNGLGRERASRRAESARTSRCAA